jgi:signal transduction histidine kinase
VLRVVLVVGGLYAIGAQLALSVLNAPAAGVAFFPPAGITLAALMLVRDRRLWPVIVATVAAAELAVDLGHGQTVAMALGFAAANTVEPVVSARLLLRRADARNIESPHEFRRFVAIGVVLGPLVGAVIGATTTVLTSASTSSWLSSFGIWWAGDAIGVLVIGTPVLAWALRVARRNEHAIPIAESLTVTVVAVGVAALSLFVWDETPLYLIALVLMLAALRCGFAVVATSGFLLACIADVADVAGRGGHLALADGNPSLSLLSIQLFLGLTLISTLVLATEVLERQRVQRELARVEADRFGARLNAVSATMEERDRIAGEVHDIVSHSLSVVLLQVGAARRLAPIDASRSLEMLRSVEESARGGLRELDLALRVVGHAEVSDGQTSRGLAQLPIMAAAMTDAGVPVEVQVRGDPRPLATLTDWSAYRVVQEALTNVLKHARATRVSVTVAYEPGALSVEVVDDGRGVQSGGDAPGRGVLGMHERVTALGGTLRTGGMPDGGYFVDARFPTEPGP